MEFYQNISLLKIFQTFQQNFNVEHKCCLPFKGIRILLIVVSLLLLLFRQVNVVLSGGGGGGGGGWTVYCRCCCQGICM